MTHAFPGKPMVRDVKVVLVCGCRIRLRDRPNSPGSKFACPNGLGHGYNIGWASWIDTTKTASGENPLHTKEI